MITYQKLFSFLGFTWFKILKVVSVGEVISQYEIDLVNSTYDSYPGIGSRIGSRDLLERYFGRQLKGAHFDQALTIDDLIQLQAANVIKLYSSVTFNPILMAVNRLKSMVQSGEVVTLGHFSFRKTTMPNVKGMITITPETYFYKEALLRSKSGTTYSAKAIAMEFLVDDWKEQYSIHVLQGAAVGAVVPVPEQNIINIVQSGGES